MKAPQNIIALIFDFDDTLTDDSTSKLLEANNIDVKEFWNDRVKERVTAGWDPTLAYLDLILESVGDGKPLENMSNQRLREFGETLLFYDGIPDLFDDLKTIVGRHTVSRPSIEFYIVSGGLEEIITGSSIANYFSGLWGCRFDEEDGTIAKIKNVISFIEKTKFLFYINKGFHKEARSNQYLVNEYVAEDMRRIPLDNMIYIGDGITDVPCFSLIEKNRGKAFGVFNPERDESPKKAYEKLVAPKRVSTMNSPRYGESDDLGALIRAAVEEICLRLDTSGQSAVPR